MKRYLFSVVAGTLVALLGLGPQLVRPMTVNLAVLDCLRRTKAQAVSCSLSLRPDDLRADYHLGVDTLWAGLPEQATAYLTRHFAADPHDQAGGLYLGMAYRQVGKDAAAFAIWRQIGAGSYFILRGKQLNSIDDLQTAIQSGEDKATSYYLLGDALWAAGRLEEARHAYEQGVALAENKNSYTWIALGRLKELSGNWPEAVQDYQQAVEASPLTADGYIRIGDIYYKHFDNPTEALSWYERCTRSAKGLWCYLLAAEVERNSGHYEVALDWAKQAQGLFPSSPFPLISAGLTWEARGGLSQARAAYLQAETLEPGSIWPPYYLGSIAARTENWSDAVTHYRRVVDLNPSDPEMILLLANACLKAGYPKEAIAAYQRVLELIPGDARAAAALAELEK